MEHLDTTMKLSVSRLNSISFCAKAHHYQYTLGLEPKSSTDALDNGLSTHKALETYYKTGEMPIVPEDQGEAGDKLRSNVVAYKLMAQTSDRFEVVDVEREFNVPLEDLGVQFAGVIDLVVRLEGELWIVEHKTCSQHWSDERIGMSSQHVLYEMVAEDLYGEPVKGTIYNFLRTTKRGGEFHTDVRRVVIPASDPVRQAVWTDLESKLQVIQSGYNARNPGQHCKWCRMYALCQTELVGGDTQYVIDNYYQPKGSRNATEDDQD